MPVRAVIFDMGGVLIRTEDKSGRRKWEKRLGLKEDELADIVFGSDIAARAAIGELKEADVWNHVAMRLGLNDVELKELKRDFWSGDRVNLELVQFLRGLKTRLATAILSNAWPGARRSFTEEYGLGDVVQTIIISAEEGIMKPDRRIYQIAARRIGVEPNLAVFVDDVRENVDGALAAGMQGIRYTSNAQVLADLRSLLPR